VTEEMFGGQHRVDEAETARAGWGDTNETGSHRDAISRAIGRVCSWTEKIRIKSLETVGVVRDVRTNLRDEILKLKQEQGKNILIGGVDIPSQLIELGLVDEYRFVVQPIIAGEGRRLLEGISLPEKLQLKLVESKILKSGSVALHYLKQ
jgi:dihydrofolate reductase